MGTFGPHDVGNTRTHTLVCQSTLDLRIIVVNINYRCTAVCHMKVQQILLQSQRSEEHKGLKPVDIQNTTEDEYCADQSESCRSIMSSHALIYFNTVRLAIVSYEIYWLILSVL